MFTLQYLLYNFITIIFQKNRGPLETQCQVLHSPSAMLAQSFENNFDTYEQTALDTKIHIPEYCKFNHWLKKKKICQ